MGTVSLVHGSIVNGHLIAVSSKGRGKSVSNLYSLQSFPLVKVVTSSFLLFLLSKNRHGHLAPGRSSLYDLYWDKF